ISSAFRHALPQNQRKGAHIGRGFRVALDLTGVTDASPRPSSPTPRPSVPLAGSSGKKTQADIPEGSLELDGHRYFIFKIPPRNWKEAKTFCEKKGGHLAIIDSRREFEALAELRKTVLGERSWAWIGGEMPEGDEDWKWLDGKSLTKQDPWSNMSEFENPHETERFLVFGPGDVYSGYHIASRFVTGFICEWESG